MPDILISDDGPIRTVRMNRPEKKNALTFAMYDAMAAAIEEAGTNTDLRCLMIFGHDSGFCAGNDIGDFVSMAQTGALGAPIVRFLHALARCETPLVAAVEGPAIGIGTTMLLHCDHVVASPDARFSTPFVALGLLPEAGSSLIAPRLMGHARAFELLVMGHPLNATMAKEASIVTTIADDVEGRALMAACEIAALPAEGVLTARRLMRGSPDEIVGRIDAEAEAFKARIASAEARAAFAAFLNRKR
jgi:enoyl-CoA hydratase/carnithine racemase